MKKTLAVVAVLALAALATPALAHLEFQSDVVLGGQGLGSVLTVLTIHNTGTESGCVTWNGTADVIDGSPCEAILGAGLGGDESTGASQTLTRTFGEADITEIKNFRILFNGAESDTENSATMVQLVALFYADDGTLLHTATLTPVPLEFSISLGRPAGLGGTGGSGYLFKLDTAEATTMQGIMDAMTAEEVANIHVGLAAEMSGTEDGNETFALAKFVATDIQVTKDDGLGGGDATIDTPFTYTIVVTNNGPDPALGVTLVDTLPTTGGITFGTVNTSMGTCGSISGGVLNCTIGDMATPTNTGYQATITIQATPHSGPTSLLNTVTVATTTVETNETNNSAQTTTPVGAPPHIEVTIDKSSVASALVGSTFNYVLAVHNVSSVTADTVTVTDTLPATVEYVPPLTGQALADCGVVTNVVTCTTTNLTSGSTVTWNIPVMGTVPTTPAKVSNTACITGTGDQINDGDPTCDPADTEITCPTISIAPTPASVPSGQVGVPYSNIQFVASGGQSPYTYEFAGNLPDPLAWDGTDTIIGGTPTQAGDFDFDITATDDNGCEKTENYTIHIGTPPVVAPIPTLGLGGLALLVLLLAGAAIFLLRRH